MPADEKFSENLLRMIGAGVVSSTALVASREMFGRSYFSLGVAERQILDAAALQMIIGNYHSLTAESLANLGGQQSPQASQEVGFRAPIT